MPALILINSSKKQDMASHSRRASGARVLHEACPSEDRGRRECINNDTSQSDALAVQAAAAAFTTDATLKDKLVVFEIVLEQCMDVTNGFRSIALQTGASAANITRAELFVLGSYEGASAPNHLRIRGIVICLRCAFPTTMPTWSVFRRIWRERPGSSSRRRDLSRRGGEWRIPQ